MFQSTHSCTCTAPFLTSEVAANIGLDSRLNLEVSLYIIIITTIALIAALAQVFQIPSWLDIMIDGVVSLQSDLKMFMSTLYQLSNLERLNVMFGVNDLTDTHLIDIAKYLPSLQHMKVSPHTFCLLMTHYLIEARSWVMSSVEKTWSDRPKTDELHCNSQDLCVFEEHWWKTTYSASEAVQIVMSPWVTSEGIEALAGLTNLRAYSAEITNASLSALQAVSTLRSLTCLEVCLLERFIIILTISASCTTAWPSHLNRSGISWLAAVCEVLAA